MFTAVILACQLQSCTIFYNDLFFENRLECLRSMVNEGSLFVMQSYPMADHAEFYCIQWEGPKEGSPT